MLSIMKKILLSLFVWLIWLINFWYCDLIDYPFINWSYLLTTSSSSSRNQEIITNWQNICVFWYWDWNWLLAAYDWNPIWWGSVIVWIDYWEIYCSDSDFWIRNNSSNTITVFYWTKPLITSLDCQTEYNLIPISSVDQNYCVNNWLCPSSECPDVPIWTWNWSALYINDIQHLGKPIINITFPDYLDWDYTTTENEFNLDIVWYPVDTEYIDWIIRTQNYKPTSEDFTQLVWMLAPYSKYLLFLLFIFIIWAWIKKPFKSKKL